MRRTLECAWNGRGVLSSLLLPLAGLFGLLAGLRRGMYRRGWMTQQRVPAAVIVIGNISVGGSGKTPLTIELAQRFTAQGRKVGIVSRGYGGRKHLAPHRVSGTDKAADCGDEPLLMARRCACPVVVAVDRVAAAQHLCELGCDLILADDGLQHYRLARDLEIIVVDGRRGFGNGRLLPAGPLREPVSRLRSADFVWYNGPTGPGQDGYQLTIDQVVSLSDASVRPLSGFGKGPVHGVAGIGSPARFFAALRHAGLQVHEHAFPDHHDFVPADLDFVGDEPVFMTEKDGVKCESFARPNWYSVPARVELPESLWRQLNDRLLQVIHG